MPPLQPQLAEFERQFGALKDEASNLVKGLNESQFNWRPFASSWSVAECLQHLNMIGGRYVHVLEQTLAQAAAQGPRAAGPFAYGWFGGWILKNTEPPPKRRFKAGRSFQPVYGQPVTAVLPTFLHLQGQLAGQVQQANGLDLETIKAPAPGLGPLRFSLLVTFAWIAAHERRHLWQADQVRRNPAFPQS